MFERYTEAARLAIFYARYEASQFGSPFIETEHLLLGLSREGGWLRQQLEIGHWGAIRNRIESLTTVREHIPTSVDLPLSHECKRSLSYAAEEAETLGDKHITSGHLTLGLLRVDGCLAADMLREHGITYEGLRQVVSEISPSIHPGRSRTAREEEPKEQKPTAPSLAPLLAKLQALLETTENHLERDSEAGHGRLKRKPWSRIQALGHLVDLATAHHQWLARALTEPRLAISLYPQDEWVAAQQYQDWSWPDMVDCWVSLNRLLVHVLTVIPENKVNITCRIGIEEPTTLLKLIERYVERCEDTLEQILSRL